jgi:hypothetical protein
VNVTPCPRCGRTDGLYGPGLRQCWHHAPPPVENAAEHRCSECNEPGGFYGPERRCWPCWCAAAGVDPSPGQTPQTRGHAPRAVASLLSKLSRALGDPVATPEVVNDGSGGRERARFRIFRWACPVCGAGRDDALYRPFSLTSDGAVTAECCGADAEQIATNVRHLLDVAALVDALDVGVVR